MYLVRIGKLIVPLYSTYFMIHNPQNTLSTTAIKKYNEFKSVRIEVLKYLNLKEIREKSTIIHTSKGMIKKTYHFF